MCWLLLFAHITLRLVEAGSHMLTSSLPRSSTFFFLLRKYVQAIQCLCSVMPSHGMQPGLE